MTDKELFQKYLEKLESIKEPRYFKMKEDFYNGQHSYLRMKFKGSSVFNPIWIDKIEDCMYELDQITNNPREVTTAEGSVVPIELAKKVNYESVQHLASHSQYVKEINEEGEVVPAKILGFYNKEELHTYENRFIATFIRKLTLFIDKRYEFIQKTVSLDEKEIVYVKNKSIVDGQEVEVETKITVTRELEDDLSVAARDYIARIKKLKEYIGYYYNSLFMKEFKTEKNVRKPIVLTNVLRKNPLYRKCYETFLFIEKFDSLGVSFKVDRDYQEFNEKERNNLSHILLSDLLYLENTENNEVYQKSSKVYKPKLLDSIDDEIFLYDDLVKGPVQYVRCDETYLKRHHELIPKDLPAHPNKSEKMFYKKEYDLRKQLLEEEEDLDALLARVRHKIEKFEKKIEDLIADRKLEEAKEYESYLDELRREEQDILNKKREQIILAARRQLLENEKYAAEHPNEEEEDLIIEKPRHVDVPEDMPLEEKVEDDFEEPFAADPLPEEPIYQGPVEETVPVEDVPAEEVPPQEVAVEHVVVEEAFTGEKMPDDVSVIEEPVPAVDPFEGAPVFYVVDETPGEYSQEKAAENAENPTESAPIEETPISDESLDGLPVYYIVEEIKYDSDTDEEGKK